jgi:predicted ArsR family transcriptional regulator
MSGNRKRILKLVEMSDGLTTGELSESLGVSATAIRRHLRILEEQELVEYCQEQRGVGRPTYVYRAKNGGPNAFPQSYDAFVRSVLEEADHGNGHVGLDELFRQRQEQRYEPHITQANGKTLNERVASLAHMLEQDGRLTSWQKTDEERYILRQHNCPLRRMTPESKLVCSCELTLLREMLKAQVQRLDHIASGGVACVYEIRELPRDGGAEIWRKPARETPRTIAALKASHHHSGQSSAVPG